MSNFLLSVCVFAALTTLAVANHEPPIAYVFLVSNVVLVGVIVLASAYQLIYKTEAQDETDE